MNKIPVHTTSNLFPGEIAMLKRFFANIDINGVDYAHRDNYYVFFFMEKGHAKMVIDFKEYEFSGTTIHCILPGQIHFPIGPVHAQGWFLAVDSVLVKDDYKRIFEKVSVMDSNIQPDQETFKELRSCVSVLEKRIVPGRGYIEESIVHDLLSYYIGILAEIYQKGFPFAINNRPTLLTFRFKSLLSAHLKTMKRPSQYASLLNISPAYLNEVIKKTTGRTVSDWVQEEIVLQAKRLLFYTDLSIKEIALELGYEDWAYFTRLFTKVATVSPTQFRKNYLK